MVPKGMRTYVDVYLRVGPDGHETPEVIALPDGRLFRIDAVERWQRVQDGYAVAIRIGKRMTTLWKGAVLLRCLLRGQHGRSSRIARHEKGPVTGAFAIRWCGRKDLNLHGVAPIWT